MREGKPRPWGEYLVDPRLRGEIFVFPFQGHLRKGQGDLQKQAKDGFYYRSYIFQIQTLFLRVCLLFKSIHSANHGKPVASGQFNDAVKCGLWLTFSVLMPAGTWGAFFLVSKKIRQ